jgi:hypothetical protein
MAYVEDDDDGDDDIFKYIFHGYGIWFSTEKEEHKVRVFVY